MLAKELDVLLHSDVAFGGVERKGDLGAKEAHLLHLENKERGAQNTSD